MNRRVPAEWRGAGSTHIEPWRYVCFGIGEGELAIIVVFGFLLFGPDKLPQMGHTIGRAIRQFRETQEKMTAVVRPRLSIR